MRKGDKGNVCVRHDQSQKKSLVQLKHPFSILLARAKVRIWGRGEKGEGVVQNCVGIIQKPGKLNDVWAARHDKYYYYSCYL